MVKLDDVFIVGVGATAQGRHPRRSAWDLGVEAFVAALSDARLTTESVDGLVTQQTQDGSGQMEVSRFGQLVGLNPAASGSLHYGTSGFSIAFASALVASGQAECVACVYATNQKTGGYRFRRPLRPEWDRFGAYNPATMSALGFVRYLFEHDADPRLLGHYALTMRRNAMDNEIAYRRKPLTMNDYEENRMVTWPLRVLDIASISDGGASLIVANGDVAARTRAPIRVAGIGRRDGLRMLQNKDHLLMPNLRQAASSLIDDLGASIGDFDVLYIQDPHSPMVPMTLELLGVVGPGKALEYIAEGGIARDGPTPVNPNGGQLSEGYMVGWLHHVDAIRQLRGEAGRRQIDDCHRAFFCASGGFREYSIAIAYTKPMGPR